MSNVEDYCRYCLQQSDWTQLPDVPLSVNKKEEWAITRQTWRDIPNIYTNPDDVIWPVIPTE